MVRKTRIDFVNDPVQLAVRMLQDQQKAAMDSLQVGKKTSLLRRALPPEITVKEFVDIMKGSN
jgi:hypothetical protein